MPHDRLRKFNIKNWFGQGIDWDGAMVVRCAEEIYVTGVNGSELDASRTHGTGHTAEDAAVQAEIALNNLKTLLTEAGASLDDICKINVYISDRAYRIPVYRTIGRHLRGIHPVSTGVIVNGFARPEILFTLDVCVVPHRGTPMPPTDPLIYRFYELVMVNGPACKALIEEEFGDGIMSAIDFDLQMERQPDPRGDRVKITMTGKFLPYKYYGATGNVPQYGYKEE